MPKVRLLSYDVSTADELHGQWQPREEGARTGGLRRLPRLPPAEDGDQELLPFPRVQPRLALALPALLLSLCLLPRCHLRRPAVFPKDGGGRAGGLPPMHVGVLGEDEDPCAGGGRKEDAGAPQTGILLGRGQQEEVAAQGGTLTRIEILHMAHQKKFCYYCLTAAYVVLLLICFYLPPPKKEKKARTSVAKFLYSCVFFLATYV